MSFANLPRRVALLDCLRSIMHMRCCEAVAHDGVAEWS
jgi:hypothetical protein